MSASALVGAIPWAAAVPSSGRVEVLALGLQPSQQLALEPSGWQVARLKQSVPKLWVLAA